MRVTVTEDHRPNGGSGRPVFEYENTHSDYYYYGLATIQYQGQGEIIKLLRRKYGEDMEVNYSLYEDYLEYLQDPYYNFPDHREPVSPTSSSLLQFFNKLHW